MSGHPPPRLGRDFVAAWMAAAVILAATLPVAAQESTGYLPRLRHVAGRETVTRVVLEQDVRQGFLQRSVLQSTTTYVVRAKTQRVDGEQAIVQLSFDRLAWVSERGVTTGAFDTATAAQPDERPEFAALRALIGKPFTVRLDDRGVIHHVDGLDAVVRGAMSDHRQPAEAMFLSALVGEANLRHLLRLQYAWLPETAVNPGQSWTHEESKAHGAMTIKRQSTLTLVEPRAFQESAERLNVSSRIQVSGEPGEGRDAGAVRVTSEIVPGPPGSATIVFHRELGLVETLEADVAFTMRLHTAPRDQPSKVSTDSQTARAKTRVTLLEVDGQPR